MAKIRQWPWAVALLAASLQAEEQTLRSRSGQFLVRGLSLGPRFIDYGFTNRMDYVRLDPAVLAVSCERIKQRVLEELELPDAWKGSIDVRVFAVRQDNEPVRLTSVRFNDGWSYGLEIPEWVTRQRLVKAVSQAVLLEVANRKAAERAAELPIWLLEGLTTYLLANTPEGLTLEPATRTVKHHVAEQSLAPAREWLRSRAALTLDELSWPSEQLLNDPGYEHCAHLFVHELLQLRGGRRCLAQMVARLAEYYNWQTTFLDAFGAHFRGLVDLDKWWALMIAHIRGRDAMSVWPLEEAVARLDEVLLTPVQVRAKLEELPHTAPVTLQTIIAEWDDEQEELWLGQKISQLQAVRLRSPPEALPMLDGYLLALQNRARGRINQTDTVRRLNELDALRLKRTNPPPPAPVRR